MEHNIHCSVQVYHNILFRSAIFYSWSTIRSHSIIRALTQNIFLQSPQSTMKIYFVRNVRWSHDMAFLSCNILPYNFIPFYYIYFFNLLPLSIFSQFHNRVESVKEWNIYLRKVISYFNGWVCNLVLHSTYLRVPQTRYKAHSFRPVLWDGLQ